MSSETSTEQVRLKPDAAAVRASGCRPTPLSPGSSSCWPRSAARPRSRSWRAGRRHRRRPARRADGAAALVGMAALRTLRPLVSPEEDRTAMVGQRTRVALEREKMLALRSIKELEFDRAMGKLSDEDWQEMSGRLRARAARLMRQLDAGAGYREQIERDLAKRLGATRRRRRAEGDRSRRARLRRQCATAANDADARFCKSCGQRRCDACMMSTHGHEGDRTRLAARRLPLCVLGVLACLAPPCRVAQQAQLRRCRIRSRCPAFRGRSTTCRTARSRCA